MLRFAHRWGLQAANFKTSRPPSQLARAQTSQDCGDGQRQNLDIEPERPTVDVLHVQNHPLLEGYGIAAGDLPQTSNSRRHAEPPPLPVLTEKLVIADGHSPGTN